MKYLTFLILLYSDVSLGQAPVKLRIPMVIENKKIDILLDSNIVYAKHASCFNIHFDRLDNEVDVYGVKTDLKVINLGKRVVPLSHKKNSLLAVFDDNLRYFEYRGYLIFVSGNDDNFNFFKKTNSSKVFAFLDMNKIKLKPGQFPVPYLSFSFYQYYDGSFKSTLFNHR